MRDDVTSPDGQSLPDAALIERFLSGQCTKAEEAHIHAWAGRTPQGDLLADVFRAMLRTGPRSAPRSHIDPEKMRDDLRLRLGYGKESPAWRAMKVTPIVRQGPLSQQSRALPEKIWLPKQWSTFVAASACMLGALGFWGWYRDIGPFAGRQHAAGPWKSYTAVRGQRATVRLADGTKVVLAADSRLRVPQDRNATREVELTGEAYFEIAHDPSHPFIVRTAQATVTELGTAFGVRSYPTDTETRVVVATGRVNLAMSRGKGSRLAAGDVGRTSSAGVVDVTHNVDVRLYTAWVDGELRFANAPLRTVVDALERWYDVKIVLADSAFGAYPLTATLRDGSAESALSVITKSLGLRYEWHGNVIQIVGN